MSNTTAVMPGTGDKPAPKRTGVRTTEVTLSDGKTYKLAFSALEALHLEELTGVDFLAGKIELRKATSLRAFLFVCLQRFHADEFKTVQDAGALAVSRDIFHVTEHLFDLMFYQGEKDPKALAPFVPTDLDIIDLALKVAGVKEGDTFVDLGCGDGRTLMKAATVTKRHVFGIELNAERATAATGLLQATNTAGTVIQGYIQDTDLRVIDPSVVFVYLLGKSNLAIMDKLTTELKPGTVVVSHDFVFLGWQHFASEQIEVKDSDGGTVIHTVYAYRIGATA